MRTTRSRWKAGLVAAPLVASLLIALPGAAGAAPVSINSDTGTDPAVGIDAGRADFSFNPVTELTAETFANPPAADLPWVRINMPATATPAGLQAQLQELADAGIGGAEYGQGAYPNDEQLVAILTKANELGIKVSLSHGPTQTPPGYSINDDNARKNLFKGQTVVNGGAAFTGALPAPTPASANRSTLVAVLAYKCVAATCETTGVVNLDRSSVIDLTSQVTGKNTLGVSGGTTAGDLSWTAPAGGQWQLVSFWSRGVFAQPDLFSTAGTNQTIAAMNAAFTPEIKALLRANGGDIMFDSHSSDRGSPDELWTNTMAQDFKTEKYYDLTPNLAALFYTAFTFSDGSASRVRNDLFSARGNIWIEKHIEPMQAYVRTFNNVLRLQPEGERNPTIAINDMIQAAVALDRPEHENLFVGDNFDNYLPIASANHMTGNTWYSTECCATVGKNYLTTYEDLVTRMNKSFVGGITKLVYHVYPYAEGTTYKWPGYANFGPNSFSGSWGPRNPIWADALQENTYLARNQQVLTQGDAKTDVGVYLHNYVYPQPSTSPPDFKIWADPTLQEAGYTRDYLNSTLLNLPNATVTNKRLAVDGPGYRAMIISSELNPATDPVKTAMPVDVAQKFLNYAKAGLPIIVVGTPPNITPGNTPQEDAKLQAIIVKLLAQPTVYQVATNAAVPAKLKSLGVRPAAEPATSSSILSVHRQDAEAKTDYYFLYNEGLGTVPSPSLSNSNIFEAPENCKLIGVTLNPCNATGDAVERVVSLEGKGNPYVLDANSGTITPISTFTRTGDRVAVTVDLARDESVLIALSEDPAKFGAVTDVHVTSTDADASVQVDADTLAVQAGQAGTVVTKLSDGTTVTDTIGAVHVPIDLTNTNWHLSAEDWKPVNPYLTTFGPAATETSKNLVEVDLAQLKAWPDIPQLADSSGIGTYTTSFDLPADWSAGDGAWIDLGRVFDTFTLTVNGTAVSIDQHSAKADIGPYLKAGSNDLKVRVATTLNNRLFALDSTVVARGIVENYGLIGPVVITPYQQVVVSPQPVVLKSSATAAAIAPATIPAGGTASLSVKVTGSGGTPSGTVTVKEGAKLIGTKALVAGKATFTVGAGLAVGNHTFSVTYSGDAVFDGSADTESLTVKKATPTVTGALKATSIKANQNGSYTVTVKATGLVPTGTLTVRDGTRGLKAVTVTAAAKGKVVITLPKLKVGTHKINVKYSGNSLINGATSVSSTLTVKK